MDVLRDIKMEDVAVFQQVLQASSEIASTSTTASTRTTLKPVCILHWDNERMANKLQVKLGEKSICTEADLTTICFQEHVNFEALYLIVDTRMAEKFMKERVFDALEWLDRFSDLGKPIYVIDDIKDERKFNTTFYRLPQSAEAYDWQTGSNSQEPLINSYVQIGVENECTVKTDDPACSYITQIGESTNIANIHIGDMASDNIARITITSMEQDTNTERRLFKIFKDNQCIINSYLPLHGALLTSVEEGSIILNLKLDSTISIQDFLQHKLKEILTCLLSLVKDKLRLTVHVDSQFSVDVKDVMSGHIGQSAVTNPKTFTEKEIQTKLTWIKSNPKMIDITSPSASMTVLSPAMSNKTTPGTKLMDTSSPSERLPFPHTPSKSDDHTEKVMKSPKHKTQTQSDSYVEKSPSKSLDWSDLDLKRATMASPSTPRSLIEKTSVSPAHALKTPKKIKACHKLFKGQLPYFERPQTKTSGYFKIAKILDYMESVQYEPIYVGKSDDIGHRLDQLFKSQLDTVSSSLSPSSIDRYLAQLTPEEYENISVFWVDRTKDKHECKGCSMRDCFIREWGGQLDFMDESEEWSEGEEAKETNPARKVIFARQKSSGRTGFLQSHKKSQFSLTQMLRQLHQNRSMASRNRDVVDNPERESAYRTTEYGLDPEFSLMSSHGGPRSTTGSSTTLGTRTSDLGTKYSGKGTSYDSSPADMPLKLKKPKLERELS
ncbi:uncharacterized protein [Haliotis asinina]